MRQLLDNATQIPRVPEAHPAYYTARDKSKFFCHLPCLHCARIGWIVMAICSLAVLTYVAVYPIGILHGWQDTEEIKGTFLIKIRGIAETPSGDVWDQQDVQSPPIEDNAAFIITSFARVVNQRRGVCDGVKRGELCSRPGGCIAGAKTRNGILTGECNATSGFCLLRGWCPTFDADFGTPLNGVEDFTVGVRMVGGFPRFQLAGVEGTVDNERFGASLFDPTQPEKPASVFPVSHILNSSGVTLAAAVERGAAVGGVFVYNCDLDKKNATDRCLPSISWISLDDATETEFSYRHVHKTVRDGIEYRDVTKLWGIRLVFILEGQGRSFQTIMPLVTVIGAHVAYLSPIMGLVYMIWRIFLERSHAFNEAEAEAKRAVDPSWVSVGL